MAMPWSVKQANKDGPTDLICYTSHAPIFQASEALYSTGQCPGPQQANWQPDTKLWVGRTRPPEINAIVLTTVLARPVVGV
eukprot:1245964-Amphidinium_carterae.1